MSFNITKGRIAVIVLLVAAVFAAGLLSSYLVDGEVCASQEDNQTKRTITVSGMGKITAEPDIAYISLGVVTEAEDAKEAQTANAEKMEAIVGAIKDVGIDEKDIKTQNYSIYPKYSHIKETGESEITGYRVNNTVSVTIRDLDKTGMVIDAASEAGVNVSNSIRFGLTDNEKYYRQALAEAVVTAAGRAETIAEALGVEIDEPVAVTESGAQSPVYRYMDYGKGVDEAASTPIQPGTLDITANVTIVYEY